MFRLKPAWPSICSVCVNLFFSHSHCMWLRLFCFFSCFEYSAAYISKYVWECLSRWERVFDFFLVVIHHLLLDPRFFRDLSEMWNKFVCRISISNGHDGWMFISRKIFICMETGIFLFVCFVSHVHDSVCLCVNKWMSMRFSENMKRCDRNTDFDRCISFHLFVIRCFV